MATTYSNGTTAAQTTGWIFGGFDPGVEYRSVPGNESVVERRKRAEYVRYRMHQGPIQFQNREGTIAAGTDIGSNNGPGAGGAPTGGYPTGTARWILSDHKLENEGGVGSGMFREIESWESYTEWEEWTTIVSDLGSNPF